MRGSTEWTHAASGSISHLTFLPIVSYHALHGMKPDTKTIEQFKLLYFEEFGEQLSNEEALERFSRLIDVLRIVSLPDQHLSIDNPYGYANVRTQIK